jgi:hypothetical protein
MADDNIQKIVHHYTEQNYRTLEELNITTCYICGLPLGADTSPDHLIPNGLFITGSPKRPTLPVHITCNNKKSKDDRWFLKELSIMCGFHPDAFQTFSEFMDKAQQEQNNIGIIGKSQDIKNYKLAKTLLEKSTWGLDVSHFGENLSLLHLDEDSVSRANEYVKNMCRSLYIRNVPNSSPKDVRLVGFQYAKARVDGTFDEHMKTVQTLSDMSFERRFMQQWDDRVAYLGNSTTDNPNAGFLFIEFYESLGYLAVFK